MTVPVALPPERFSAKPRPLSVMRPANSSNPPGAAVFTFKRAAFPKRLVVPATLSR